MILGGYIHMYGQFDAKITRLNTAYKDISNLKKQLCVVQRDCSHTIKGDPFSWVGKTRDCFNQSDDALIAAENSNCKTLDQAYDDIK